MSAALLVVQGIIRFCLHLNIARLVVLLDGLRLRLRLWGENPLYGHHAVTSGIYTVELSMGRGRVSRLVSFHRCFDNQFDET